MRNSARAAVTVVALALVAACGDDSPTREVAGQEAAGEDSLGEALGWFVGVLDGQDPDAAEYETRFASSFRAEVGLAAFTAVTAQIRALAEPGWTVESLEPTGREHRANAVVRSGAVAVSIHIGVEAESPHRITALLVRPVAPRATVSSLDELGKQLQELAPNVALLAADITDGGCRPLTAISADKRVPIASLFNCTSSVR